MNKAILIDLDGTIITTRSGRDFPLDSRDWKFIDSTLKCIKYFISKGFIICIVSNQGGIEHGYVTKTMFERKINDICTRIETIIHIPTGSINYSFCPKMISYNRKPNPGMAYEMAIEHELDLANSIMIGDMESDKEFSFNAGIGTYMSMTEVEFKDWEI